jgi:H+/Cl- antiporter ClcA
MLRRRIASGRAAMDQPNVTGDGDVPLTTRFWVAVLLTGLGAGGFGILLMLVLAAVARLAFGPGADVDFAGAVERASWPGRVLPLLVAGVIGGIGWFLLRRYVTGRSDVDDAVWTGDGRLGFRRSAGTSVLSEIVVGLGASLGREAAPKLLGGACGSVVAGWARLSTPQRRLLVACGAGAGLACVYNVPLGGALFTAEVLVGAVRLPVMLPALACSAVATATAWIGLPAGPIYAHVPDLAFSTSALVWSLPTGVVTGLVAVVLVRLIAWASHRVPRGRGVLVAPLGAFAVLAAVGLAFPQLYGNGQDIARNAFIGVGALWLFAALFLLKPLVTVLCLGSGAAGGVFTPTLATGAALGAVLGGAWSQLWPGTPVGAYAMIGAAAMIGAGMQAPLAGLALVLELTHSGFGLLVPMMTATLVATAVSRWVDGYSIYSARLAERVAPVGRG